jgi:glycerophosphoryl diester phosphodiesterase
MVHKPIQFPAIEAHRGDSSNAPENTLAAFKAAIDLKAPWIELDVHPTQDGALVVIHDDTVERTTGASGAVGDLTLAEIQKLDAGSWFSPRFAGERIPQLAEVFELVAATPTRLNIEIKAAPDGLDVAPGVVDLLRRYQKEREYVVSSFDLPALLQVQAMAPEIPLAILGWGSDLLQIAQEHHFPWIHGFFATMDADIIAQAHANGMSVDVWTVDDPDSLASWKAMGVDKICTNCPALMLAAMRS